MRGWPRITRFQIPLLRHSHSSVDPYGADSELYVRLLTVVAILVGLETIVIPILMKLRKGATAEKRVLVLEQVDADVFRDSNGDSYRVEKIDMGEESPRREADDR